MKWCIVFLLGIVTHFSISGQEPIKFIVKDHAEGLPYAEVFVKGKLHQLTDEKGCLEISTSLLTVGDTILFNCLGYQTRCEVVDASLLTRKSCDVMLVERVYDLDEVKVCAGIDAERFFEKKKRNMLLPYIDNHRVDAKVQYRLLDKKEIKVSVKTPVVLDLVDKRFRVVQIVEPVDTAALFFPGTIEKVAYLSYFSPNDYCRPKWRKYFDINYKGLKEGMWVWEFRLQPDKVTVFGLAEKDKLVALVYIDVNGLIARIESDIVIRSDQSASYQKVTEYGLYKERLVPTSTRVHALLSKRKRGAQGGNVEDVVIVFSNYRKE